MPALCASVYVANVAAPVAALMHTVVGGTGTVAGDVASSMRVIDGGLWATGGAPGAPGALTAALPLPRHVFDFVVGDRVPCDPAKPAAEHEYPKLARLCLRTGTSMTVHVPAVSVAVVGTFCS